MIEFGIVGLGSWGLCVLERTVVRARQSSARIRVHLIDPGQLGGGVYSVGQPDYLVLNNPCSQLSLYASPNSDEHPPYAVGLYEWAVVRGFRWVGHDCRVGREGEPIQPTDYLPRRLMGEYLVWFYDTLLADAPQNLEIVRHYAAAVDISPEIGGRESVLLDNGEAVSVDHVVLTSGHTFNDEPESATGTVRYLRPYPVEYFDDSLPEGSSVAVAGMGLVAFDVLTALTVGRGGTFVPTGARKRYLPSGREPLIHLYSRSGVPYCAKSAHGLDPYGNYQPVVCTPEAFAELAHPGGSPFRRQVNFRTEMLPLLFAEMQARYHTHAAYLKGGAEESAAVRALLRSGWVGGRFGDAVGKLELLYGRFDPADHVFAGADRHYTSSCDYQSQVYDLIESDLDEALAEGGSPVKAAQEVLRILRDQLRSVIEFGGLSLESYIDFQSNVRGRINRLEAGPPAMRSQQLLGLIDAGVVRMDLGPDPEITSSGDGAVLRSTHLDRRTEVGVDGVVRGPPRSPVVGPIGLTAAQPPVCQRTSDPAQLRSHPGGQRCHQRGLPSIRCRGPPAAESLTARRAHRGRALLHPLPAIAAQPSAGGARRPGLRGVDHRLTTTPPEPGGGHPVARLNAWSMSAMRSSTCSKPIDRRMVSGRMPAAMSSAGESWRWVVDAGWMASDLASPRLRSLLNSCSESKNTRPASSPPAAPKVMMDGTRLQVPLYQLVIRVIGEAGEADPLDPRVRVEVRGDRPGVGLCRSSRTAIVSSPCSSWKAPKGERVAPVLRSWMERARTVKGRSGKSRANTTPWKAGSGSLNIGKRSACSVHGNRPPSTITPPVWCRDRPRTW